MYQHHIVAKMISIGDHFLHIVENFPYHIFLNFFPENVCIVIISQLMITIWEVNCDLDMVHNKEMY